MTDTLPEDAPDQESAVSSDSVPKARFDGLMSAYQRDKARLEAEIEALKARLDATERITPEPDQKGSHDVDEIRNEIAELRELLLGERLEKARYEAVAKYPEVAPLADLLVGTSPDEIEVMAAEVANRLKQVGFSATPTGQSPSVGTPEPESKQEPPTQSAPALGPNIADTVSAAVQAGDFNAYLEALASRAAQEMESA